MFYSKSTKGFYTTELHGSAIPSDAIAITSQQHADLLRAQADGKVIAVDQNNKVVAQDRPAPSAEEIQARDAKLAAQQAAQAKLTALGLTAADLKALGL